MDDNAPPSGKRLILVTGASGSGRTTALNAFQDLGYHTIDGLPLSLVETVFAAQNSKSLVIGVSPAGQDYSTAGFLSLVEHLQDELKADVEILFLEANRETLLRRFSTTRRRHPLTPTDHPSTGIRRELALLAEMQSKVDVVLNTDDLNVHDLKAQIGVLFPSSHSAQLAIAVKSFSYKRGVPRGTDMVLDVRFLQNPYWKKDLRALTGQDPEVVKYISSDTRFLDFQSRIYALLEMLLPAYVDEGKAHFSLGFGCSGGQHRSVALAETTMRHLRNEGWHVTVEHRELDQRRAT